MVPTRLNGNSSSKPCTSGLVSAVLLCQGQRTGGSSFVPPSWGGGSPLRGPGWRPRSGLGAVPFLHQADPGSGAVFVQPIRVWLPGAPWSELGGLWDLPIFVLDTLPSSPLADFLLWAFCSTAPTKVLIAGADALLAGGFRGGVGGGSVGSGGGHRSNATHKPGVGTTSSSGLRRRQRHSNGNAHLAHLGGHKG